jgi:hypothetical protein
MDFHRNIKIAADVPVNGESYIVFEPIHYASLFNAWLYQLCNIPELRQNIIKLHDEQLQGKETLSALRELFNKVEYVGVSKQIQTAKTLLMLGLEKYHPDSPFVLLPRPILLVIIQYCNGAQGNQLLNIPPRINQINPAFIFHQPPTFNKFEHYCEWMWKLYEEGKPQLHPIVLDTARMVTLSCSHNSCRLEDVICATFQVKETILESLRCIFYEERLEGENAYWCPQCHHKRDAMMSVRLQQAPQYLLMHLERTNLNLETFQCEWLQTRTAVEMILDISPSVTPENTPPVQYELYGLVLGYNRYVGCSAVIKDTRKNRWIFYDLYKGSLEVSVVKDMDAELRALQSSDRNVTSQFGSRELYGLVYRSRASTANYQSRNVSDHVI